MLAIHGDPARSADRVGVAQADVADRYASQRYLVCRVVDRCIHLVDRYIHRVRGRVGSTRPRRYFCRCGTRLAKDNPGRQCARCARASRDRLIAPPDVPAEFWQTEQFAEAFAATSADARLTIRTIPARYLPPDQRRFRSVSGGTAVQSGNPTSGSDRSVGTTTDHEVMFPMKLPDRQALAS